MTLPPPPIFTAPAIGEIFQVEIGGDPLTFDVAANASPGAGNVVLALPSGPSPLPGTATMTPELPTDGTTPAVTSVFEWTPIPGDEGTYRVDYTATDALHQVTPFHLTIEVVAAGAEVPFDPYVVTKLKIDKRRRKGTFDFRGAFGLGDASDGIDPLVEDVTIQLDSFSLTIPAGSFRRKGKHNYKFNGVIDGVRINAELKAPRGEKGDDDDDGRKSDRHRTWSFKFKGKGADLSGVENPVDTLVQIGDDSGEGPKHAKIKH